MCAETRYLQPQDHRVLHSTFRILATKRSDGQNVENGGHRGSRRNFIVIENEANMDPRSCRASLVFEVDSVT